jgi:hypothetical protein
LKNFTANDSIYAFRPTLWVTVILVGSGVLHLMKWLIDGGAWEGPLSIRKPMLFGISSGLTTWSIAWVMTRLEPRKYDRWLINGMAFGLLVEVALITLQYWRGVPSHFNHLTTLDSTIEFTMLGLILAVTLGITHVSLRTSQLRPIEPAMAIAIRGGMWLLTLSCGIGIATWLLGSYNISLGKSYEHWGREGALKFPHGVALHAIQTLPIVVWCGQQLRLAKLVRLVRCTLASQVFFLLYSLWQTSQGKARFDFDIVGGALLAVVAMLVAIPMFSLSFGLLKFLIRSRSSKNGFR